MKRQMVDYVLLQTRMRLLELLVLQLSVTARFSSGIQPMSAAVQATLEDLDACGQTLENDVLTGAVYRRLTDGERAVFANEYRKLIDQLKAEACVMFSQES